jgi:4-diphosphocytidyl-2-C-methyl-D-erythritol kinase
LTLALPARAKLNLDLEVTRRREDGFHELRTTFQAIDLHDLVEVERAEQTRFTSSGFGIDPENNSVLNALRALEAATGRSLPARIHLHKQIPPGSGMGGASSDAAATLRGLQKIYDLANTDLRPLAEQLGSDVPFFLTGGRVRAEGRGERITQLPTTPAANVLWFAIAWPGFELSTGDVYRAWDEVKGEGPNHLRRAAGHVEPRLEAFARSLGGGWQMTGSGSAFFKQSATMREAEEAIKKLDCWTAVAQSVAPWA